MLVVCLSGCGSDSSKPAVTGPEPPQAKPTTGIWSAPAYGVVVDISDTDFTFYQFTSQYCQVYPLGELLGVDFDAFIDSTKVNSAGSALDTTLAGIKIPGIAMEKQDVLPQHCVDNLVASAGDAGYEFDPRRDFEIFWLTFSELYA